MKEDRTLLHCFGRTPALVLATFCLNPLLLPAAPALLHIRIAPDGRHFETQQGQPFVPLGVTYYRPGTGWAPQVWKQWDAAATRRDFARMKDLGVNCVRVFLSFGSFYQRPGELAAAGLQKFDEFLKLAEEAGIYVHPTGPDHWEGVPEWARGDRYADEALIQAREQFWKLFAARYRGRAVIFAYDLLNEPEIGWNTPALRSRWNQWLKQHYAAAESAARAWAVPVDSLQWGDVPVPDAQATGSRPRLLDYQHCREVVADEWARRQVVAIKSVDPQALVTIGYIQWSVPVLLPGLNHYAAFRPERQVPFLDFLEIHFYPFARGFYEYGQNGDEARNLAYAQAVVRAVAQCGKPVVVAEFGWYGGGQLTLDQGRHPPASEADQARWCTGLIKATSGLAVGWLNWGLYDHPQARDVSQLTGLLTVTGATKAWGRAFQELAHHFRGQVIPPRQIGPRPNLDWDECLVDPKAAAQFRERYLQAFR